MPHGNPLVVGLIRVELRPISPSDRPFLLRLFADLRRPAFLEIGWSGADLEVLLESQFKLQSSAYASRYPDGEFLLVLEAGQPIGRLYMASLPEELRVVDLALVEPARGRGIGTHLLQLVCRRADAERRLVRFYVEVRNRAQRLYERMGFRPVAEEGPYRLLERPLS